jgi:hypothetical protein
MLGSTVVTKGVDVWGVVIVSYVKIFKPNDSTQISNKKKYEKIRMLAFAG